MFDGGCRDRCVGVIDKTLRVSVGQESVTVGVGKRARSYAVLHMVSFPVRGIAGGNLGFHLSCSLSWLLLDFFFYSSPILDFVQWVWLGLHEPA